MRQKHVTTQLRGHRLQHLTDLDDSLDKGVDKQECILSVMSGPNFSLHIDDSQSISVGSPKLNQGDLKSCDDPKTRQSKKVDEEMTGKDVDNVKRKGEERVSTVDSDDENVTKKSAVESHNLPCESIPEKTPDTIPATPDDTDDTKVKNVFPIEDERFLLDLEGLAFEHITEPSLSECSDGFFCTQEPKVDMGQSSRGDVESSNVDIKELESFWIHEDAFVYSGGLHTDGNQGVRGDDENVKDVTPNDGVGSGDSSNEVVGGCVSDGLGGDVGEENDSQSNFLFVSVSESITAAISQKYYNDKKDENEKVTDVSANTQDLVDEEFFKNLSESDIAVITQAAKVGVAWTEVIGDEQSIKDGYPENTTINAVVTEQARENVLPQGGDIKSAAIGNEYVDGGLAKRNDFVLDPPPEYVARSQNGQLADELSIKAKDIVKYFGVGPSGASGGDSNSKEEDPHFVIPLVTNVVEINYDQTIPVALQRVGQDDLLIDCGVFVACFAEYLIENIEISIANFEIDGLRSRYGGNENISIFNGDISACPSVVAFLATAVACYCIAPKRRVMESHA
ncbi:hypothetical protein RND71_018285 [Anisodus tanguticus]|uniref:Uncharacterized protein n=1 Tax=Anisodus tanguticus TaxID=243964 RepID=A0AAE1S2G7_9SOLA|nr:hypothetical protein RND71_018285 [Anisodus tanguticus]